MELRLPSAVTGTAVLNIYLVLSITVINVYAADKPLARVAGWQQGEERSEGGWDPEEALGSVNDVMERAQGGPRDPGVIMDRRLDSAVIQDRSLDVYDRYYEEEDEDLFRPSIALDDSYGQRVERRRDGGRLRQRQQPQRQRVGVRRQTRLEARPGRRPESGYQRQSPYSRAEVVQAVGPPRRPQAWKKPIPGPPPQATLGISGFDYEDYDYEDYGVQDAPKPSKKPGLLGSIFGLLRPKKPARPVEQEPNRPSWEFVQEENEVDIGEKASLVATDQFVPTNADYEDYNLNYVDTDDEPNYPQFTMKDVIHSIKNNESRIQTLKKFLSAASSMVDRSGTDPLSAAVSAPLTILSFLGVFYALSAVAVLGYKYILLTSGSSNGQAVAILPVVLLFTVPLVLVTLFLVARGTLDGQINLSRLARGDVKNALRRDFESVDFMYDLGVGATALLGLGWMVSITL